MKTHDELILEIRAFQDELVSLDVKRESINFRRLEDADIAVVIEVNESMDEQLRQRKKFLGVNQ